MSSKDTTVSAAQYWGYLIKPDKTPTPIFERLLLGVANYINRHIAPWDVHCLTPTKLATFYRLVGGDYDPLFLDTSRASLSFIYQSLGCLHTLQPEQNPYSPPTIPALTPQGFVRWQTVQLLLEPDEHVPFLQEAVKRFELTNPADGEPFPSVLPRESLPAKPDLQMMEWHDTVSEKLMLEAQASQMRNMPPRPQMALSDIDPTEDSRPSSGDSTIETSSIVGAAGYFSHPHTYQNGRPHPPTRPYLQTQPPPPRGVASQQNKRPPPAYDTAPWSPLRRRSSMPPDSTRPQYPHHPSSRPARGHGHHPTSPNHQFKFAPPSKNQHQTRPQAQAHHTRTPSTLSESSFTSDSSYTTSSASLSPVLQAQPAPLPHNQQLPASSVAAAAAGGAAATQQGGADIRRSQSLGYFNPHPPPPGHPVHPNMHHHNHTRVHFPHQRRPLSAANLNLNDPTTSKTNLNALADGTGTSRPNEKGLNVRWPDQPQPQPHTPHSGDATTRVRRSDTVRPPGNQAKRSARSVEGRRNGREKERERRGQSVGYR